MSAQIDQAGPLSQPQTQMDYANDAASQIGKSKRKVQKSSKQQQEEFHGPSDADLNTLKEARPYADAHEGSEMEFEEEGWASNAVSTDDEDNEKSPKDKAAAKRSKLKKIKEQQRSGGLEDEGSTDEEYDHNQEQKLQTGAKAALENIERSVTVVPPEILDIYQRGYLIARTWWNGKLSGGQKQKLENINREIRATTARIDPKALGTAYLFPWQEIHDHIQAFQKEFQMFSNSKGDEKAQAAKKILIGSRAFEMEMEKKGIPFKMLIHRDAIAALDKVLSSPAAGSGLQEMENLFTKPMPNQSIVLRPAGKLIPRFLDHAKGGDARNLERDLKEIEKLNQALAEVNRRIGFRDGDHMIPIEHFKSICTVVASQEEDEDEKIAEVVKHAQKIKAKLEIGGLPIEWVPDTAPKLPTQGKSTYRRGLLDFHSAGEGNFDKGKVTSNTSAGGSDPGENGSPDANAMDGVEDTNPPRPRSIEMEDSQIVPEPRYRTKSPSTAARKPKFSAFFGPELMDDGITPYGKIVHIRKAGRGLFRACVNVGTEELPYYFMRPSSDFPKGVLEKLYTKFGYRNELPSETTSWDIMYATCVMTGEAPASGKRAAPQWLTVRTLQEPEIDYITTISGLGSIRGQSQARKLRDEALNNMEEIKETLIYFKKRNVNPETEKPLSESDRSKTPWLFSDAPDPWAKNQQQMVWSPPTLRRRHPGILAGREEEQDTEDEDDVEEPPARSKNTKDRKLNAASKAVKQLLERADLSKEELFKALRRLS